MREYSSILKEVITEDEDDDGGNDDDDVDDDDDDDDGDDGDDDDDDDDDESSVTEGVPLFPKKKKTGRNFLTNWAELKQGRFDSVRNDIGPKCLGAETNQHHPNKCD